VDQHLVDDQLEEDRRDQAEQLHEERGKQHFGEDPTVTDHLRNEPGEIEASGKPVGKGTTGDQDGKAAPSRLEFLSRQFLRGTDRGILDKHLVGGQSRQDGKTAACLLDDDGQRQPIQPLYGWPHYARLEFQAFGGPDYVFAACNINTGGSSRRTKSKIMPDDIGIRWSPQILRDQRQAYHARIDWSRMRLDTVHTPAPRNRKFPHRQLLHFAESDASTGCKQKVEINC
jgi:hypothetical protein